ncbi:MAG TPA: hypothetical protein VFJ43_10775 [Bacteroidia bacterium]|nr:hypothetical protein [Bacteroidia bacterium]
MKYLIKIICVLVIYLPFQYYYEDKYHERMSFGTGFLVALVAFGVAAGIEALIKGNKNQPNNPGNNQDQQSQ